MKWPATALSEACEITMGQAPKGDSYNDVCEGLPLIAGAGDFAGSAPRAKKFTTAPGKVSRAGDIILGIRASIGDRVWSDAEYCLGRGVAGLRPKAGTDPNYLWHWLGYSSHRLAAKGRGATFLQVNRADIADMEIPLPPLDEQRRIADILDKADALRVKQRSIAEGLEALIESTFIDMFGDPVSNPMSWPMYTLGGLAASLQYGPRFHNEAYTPEGIKIARITDLSHGGNLDFSSMPMLAVADGDKRKFLLEPGDIIFACTGATVGKLALIRPDDPPCIAGAYFIRIQLRGGVNPEFASAVLRSRSVQSIIKAGSHQSAQQNFSGPGLRALPFPLPPMECQEIFGRRLESVRKFALLNESAVMYIDQLFASLQSRAFRGEL